MAFHVEIRGGGNHARVFNLESDELRARVLIPWLDEERINLGDQLWDPRQCRLTVLEGPPLSPAELAVGQGWGNARRRRSRDVTVAALEAARKSGTTPLPEHAPPAGPETAALGTGITVLCAPSESARAHADGVLAALNLRAEPWGAVRTRLLSDVRGGIERLGPTAVLVVLEGAPEASTALDLGLALGAFGSRVVVATTGAPVALPVGTIDLVNDPDAIAAIAERLRLAGAGG